jgi:dCTP deaminase
VQIYLKYVIILGQLQVNIILDFGCCEISINLQTKPLTPTIIMILSDKLILQEIEQGSIIIEPFKRESLGTNSYDVHLGKYLATYRNRVLDAKRHNEIDHFEIPKDGFVLQPNTLYLGVTLEYTETHKHVPFLEGKSSTGRLGIDIHATAGKGDVGFCNTWTLEISVAQPVRIYAGMPIGQLIYFVVEGEIETMYNTKSNAKYNNKTTKPVESMMWKNSF